MEIKTKEIKEVVEKITKLIKYNNIVSITSLCELRMCEQYLELRATDLSTHICATLIIDDEKSDEFVSVCVINMLEFNKLLKYIETEYIDIDFDETTSYVNISADGKYKLPKQLNELGKPLYLDININDHNDPKEINTDIFIKTQKLNEIALGKDSAHPEYSTYCYRDKKVYTTDNIMMAVSNNELTEEFMSPYVVNQICKMGMSMVLYSHTDEYVRVSQEENNVKYELQIDRQNTEGFSIDRMQEYENSIKFGFKIENVSTKKLVSALKRLRLFVSSFQYPIVTFENENLRNNNTTAEEILCGNVIKRDEVKTNITTDKLLSVLKNMEDTVSIETNGLTLKVSDNNVSYYISGNH